MSIPGCAGLRVQEQDVCHLGYGRIRNGKRSILFDHKAEHIGCFSQ